jgi:hypothetical protein
MEREHFDRIGWVLHFHDLTWKPSFLSLLLWLLVCNLHQAGKRRIENLPQQYCKYVVRV